VKRYEVGRDQVKLQIAWNAQTILTFDICETVHH